MDTSSFNTIIDVDEITCKFAFLYDLSPVKFAFPLFTALKQIFLKSFFTARSTIQCLSHFNDKQAHIQ